jgi:shikimate kinase
MGRLKRHVILVGLPGAGKSAVGRMAAGILGVEVRDIDTTVERRLGMTIAEIFASQGEAAFRELERRETVRALEGEPAVIIPGGGWAAQPGNLDWARGRALTVYLEAAPTTAVARVRVQGGRPLLDAADPADRMRSLLAERSTYYEACDLRLSTENKTAAQVAEELVELAHSGRAE